MSRPPLLLGVRLVRVLVRLLPSLAIAVTGIAAGYIFGVSDRLQRQIWVVAAFLLGFRLVSALVAEVLSPHRSHLRLLAMPDHRAKRMASIVRTLMWVLLGTEVAIYLVRANEWNESVAALLALIRTCGLIVVGALIVWRSSMFRRLLPEKKETLGELLRWLVVRVGFPLVVLAALSFTIAHALGYVAVAEWLLRNALTSLLVLFLAVVLYRWLADRIRQAVAFMRDERREEGTEPSPAFVGVERIALGGLRLAAIVVTGTVLLSTWEVGTDWLHARGTTPLFGAFGPPVGPFLYGVGTAALVAVLGALLRNVLVFFVFPGADVEVGTRYAILTILRYVVIVVAAMYVLQGFGLDASALAVFAGAFGVGLAFGLQDIFANFFSGLIMLVERPVRVGDAVEVGGTSGHVEAIRLRGTVIRTFDKTTVLIPNRQLIGERVTNLTHDMETARITVLVGASYDADPSHVKDVLQAVVENDGRVHDPIVRLDGFGASSIDFSMRCYTHHVGDRGAIGSDLRSAVLMAFRREGIEIPFPQHDVRIVYDVRHPPLSDSGSSPQNAS